MLLPDVATKSCQDIALVILAPSKEECTADGWLVEAVRMMASKLATDGVGYILAPRRWRLRIARLVRDSGLVIDLTVGHLPNWESSDYLVPFARSPIEYALSVIAPAPARIRALIGKWFRLPRAAEMLAYLRSYAGLVVRRPGARPVFEWLFGQDEEEGRRGSALIRRSWRGKNGTAVIYRFLEGDKQPSAVAKVNLAIDSSADPYPEVAVLTRIGSRIQGTGIRVPQLLSQPADAVRRAPLQTFVAGRPAADVLRLQPERLAPTVKQVVRWLERWYCRTVVHRPFSAAEWNGHLLEPAARLAPLLAQGDEYRRWLASRCMAAAGAMMPLVDAHNDLTMANILLDEEGGMGVIDWETGKAEAWPLVDFFYAITDAVMMVCGWPDRLDAFRACFAAEGLYAPAVARLGTRLASAVAIPQDIGELCFHACWLHHAINEHHASQECEARPFLRIVQWLAARHPKSGERLV